MITEGTARDASSLAPTAGGIECSVGASCEHIGRLIPKSSVALDEILVAAMSRPCVGSACGSESEVVWGEGAADLHPCRDTQV